MERMEQARVGCEGSQGNSLYKLTSNGRKTKTRKATKKRKNKRSVITRAESEEGGGRRRQGMNKLQQLARKISRESKKEKKKETTRQRRKKSTGRSRAFLLLRVVFFCRRGVGTQKAQQQSNANNPHARVYLFCVFLQLKISKRNVRKSNMYKSKCT